MARTNENYLRWKFGRSVAERYTSNVTPIPAGEDAGVALEPGESAIARIALNSEAVPLLLTDMRLIRGAEALVRFDDVAACIWIDRDATSAARLKSEKFDRLILELRDGREVTIDGLGQAVFPLLSFFLTKLRRWPRRAMAGSPAALPPSND